MSVHVPSGDEAEFQQFLDGFVTELQSSGVATGGEISQFQAGIASYRNNLNATNIRSAILDTAKATTIQKKQDYVDQRVVQTNANADYRNYRTYKNNDRKVIVGQLRDFYARIHTA